MTAPVPMLGDARADAVLASLHVLERRQLPGVIAHHLPRMLWSRLMRGGAQVDTAFMRDKLVALDADKAMLCHRLCRALDARRVVEVGTSFGVSTIVLADAVRTNAKAGGSSRVIATEIEPTKAAAARRHWRDAGVADWIELREGDALLTLQDCGGLVDFALVDTWMPLARPALELLMPQLRPGAMAVCDNATQFAREYTDYLALVRDAARGWESVTLPYRGGVELSVWRP